MARHTYARRKRRYSPALLIIGIILGAVLLVNFVPRLIALFNVSKASADTLDPPVRTAFVRAALSRPALERAGTCGAHSAIVPRSDAFACTVADQVYDPCFAVPDPDKPTAIVCGAEPTSGAPGFIVHGAFIAAPDNSAARINPAALASLTVDLDLIGVPITLVKGQFYAPNVERTGGSVLIAQSQMSAGGDLDDDGDDDVAGLLVADAGDGRMFIYLYAARNDDGAPVPAGSIELGDRVKVDALDIHHGQIYVSMTTHTGDDPACCPTLDVVYAYNLVGGTRLVQYVDGWRLELQGGVQCQPLQSPQASGGSSAFAYQCSNGAWLHSGLAPGRVWYAQPYAQGDALDAAVETRSPPVYAPIVRIWQ